MEMLVFSGAKGCSFEDFRFRRRERGALRSPTPPRVTGARGLRPSRALPGLDRREFGFPTMQETASVEMLVSGGTKGCSDEDFISDDVGSGFGGDSGF